MMAARRSLVRAMIAIAVLGGFAYLFVRSARGTRETAYTVNPAHLRNWTLALESAPLPASPILVLRTPQELGAALFKQVFARGMESLSAPATPAVPLLLRSEFDSAFADRLRPAALLEAARAFGVESAPFTPRCLAYRRVSDPGVTRQVYFLLFTAPAFSRFRQHLGSLPEAAGGTFDAAAMSPVLLIGASDDSFNRWLPLRANPEADCVAPIE